MIPAGRYSPAHADALKNYLVDEIYRATSERAPLEQRWMRLNQKYKCQPDSDIKTFPWYGASNLVAPIIATDVDIIYARIMAMLYLPQNMWTCIPSRPDMLEFAPRLQEFLQWAQENEIKLYDPVADFILELTKLGTGVLKTRYTREYKKVYEYREIQGESQQRSVERQMRMLLKNHPSVHHVSLFDFYVPSSASSTEDAQWCAERVLLSWAALVNRINAGIYSGQGVDQTWIRSYGSDYERFQQRLDRYNQSRPDRVELFEFWLDWDIDGDGEQEALVCTIHVPTRTYVRLDFNPFFNQEKPYEVARFLRQPKRFYGLGIGEMLEQFQDERSTMHNQRIDNASVRNAQIIVALKTGNVKQDEPFWPGRVILVDDINEIKSFSLGSASADYSTIPDEQQSQDMGSKRTGVNDQIAGDSTNSANYAAATTTTAMLREGSKRFDQTLREVRRALSGTGLKVAELYQQFNQFGKPYMAMGAKDGQLVEQILSFPLEIIRAGVAIDVTATSASYNKDMEIRNNTIAMQQLTQYYMQVMQAMSLAINPMVPPQLRQLAVRAADAGTVLMDRILDNQGIQDKDRMLPNIMEMLNGANTFGPLNGALTQAGNGGAAVGGGPGAPPGLPSGQAGFGVASGNGAPQAGGGENLGRILALAGRSPVA